MIGFHCLNVIDIFLCQVIFNNKRIGKFRHLGKICNDRIYMRLVGMLNYLALLRGVHHAGNGVDIISRLCYGNRVARKHIVLHRRYVSSYTCGEGKYERNTYNTDRPGNTDHRCSALFGEQIMGGESECCEK